MKTVQLPAITGPILVITASLGILLIGYFDYKNISYMKNSGIETEAVILDVAKHLGGLSRATVYVAYVKFVTKDGIEVKVRYEHNGKYSNPQINTIVRIYYDPADPNKIIWKHESFSIVWFVVGSLFLAAGILGSWQMYKTVKKKKRLMEIDYRVMADIHDISKKGYTTRSGGSYYFFIHASYTEGGQKHDFKSQQLNFDPSAFLNTKVPVYVDPHNYDDYYVDTDSLVNK